MFRIFSRKRLDKIKHVWGTGTVWRGARIQHWLQHPLVQDRINLKVSGSPGVNRFEYFLRRYLDGKMPVDRALTLGSGAGELERGLCHYSFATLHEGIDISDVAIRGARESAATGGFTHLHYRAENLNALMLEPRVYDVIFGISSIHHVQDLEHLFGQVRDALKPGGYFFLDEFIGPARFQWTPEQLRAINEQLRGLPDDLRRHISDGSKFKERVVRRSVDEIVSADPSEAIRSAEIVPLLSEFFTVLEIKGYGGAILHELLYDIAGNFSEENAGSLERLQRIFQAEDDLTAAGTLANDFAVVIATTKA